MTLTFGVMGFVVPNGVKQSSVMAEAVLSVDSSNTGMLLGSGVTPAEKVSTAHSAHRAATESTRHVADE